MKIKKITEDKKAQVISVTVFFVIVLAVFIVGFLLMSFVNTLLSPVSSGLGNVSTQAGQSVTKVNNIFNSWWDGIVIFLFIVNVLLLLYSAFMVDIHPIWLFIYILSLALLFIFGNNVIGALSTLWDGSISQFDNATSHMPLTLWILNNFTIVLLGIAILSGIIMYAKFKFIGGPTG
jgi:hypothetical protein